MGRKRINNNQRTIEICHSLHLKRHLNLGKHYNGILQNIIKDPTLQKYINNKSFFICKQPEISYVTERICPQNTGNRTPIVLLFSNPYPDSMLKGIFLSGVRRFWKSMQHSEMLTFTNFITTPTADIMNQLSALEYESEFVFYFYCFFDFPSRNPKQLKDFLGNYFDDYLKQSYNELSCFLRKCRPKHIICFGQQAFKYISKLSEDNNEIGKDIKGYTKLIRKTGYIPSVLNSKVANCENTEIKLYLTYPTGQGEYDRAGSLRKIKGAIK